MGTKGLVQSLRKKCPYSKLFWFIFPHIRTEHGEILRTSSCSVQMREDANQNYSEYGHFLRSRFHKGTLHTK